MEVAQAAPFQGSSSRNLVCAFFERGGSQEAILPCASNIIWSAAATEPGSDGNLSDWKIRYAAVGPSVVRARARALSIVLLKDGLEIQRLISPKIERTNEA